jgi:hypothetical protein
LLTFDKTYEIIERVENYGGFLLVRQLHTDDNLVNYPDDKIIADIIASKFHHWQGEKHAEGIEVQMSSSDKNKNVKTWTLSNHKFYGFFDNCKIKPEHYKRISPDNFYDKLFQAFIEQDDNDKIFIDKATEIISGRFDDFSIIYFLDLDKELNSDLVAEWQVYDFFYAFIALDRQKNIVTLIEFGLD